MVGSKLEESRSSYSLLACRLRMFHCKIIGIKNQKRFWLSESESASSTSVPRGEYRLFVGSSESDLVSELRPTIFVCFIRLSFMWFLKEALGEGRRAESFFAVLLLAVAAGSCRAEAVEAPPIRRFGEIVCEAIDLCGICAGSSCPDGHVRSVCTTPSIDADRQVRIRGFSAF